MSSNSPVVLNPADPSFSKDSILSKNNIHIPLQNFSFLADFKKLSPSHSNQGDPDTPDFSPNKARDIMLGGLSTYKINEESEDDTTATIDDMQVKKVNSNPESSNTSMQSFPVAPGPSKFKRSRTEGLNKNDQSDSNEYETGSMGSNGKGKSKGEKRKEIMQILELSRQNNKRTGNDAGIGIFGNFKLKDLRQYLDSH
jgi:hypothetical protein